MPGHSERTVGAALRGRPWFAHEIRETMVSSFGEYDFKPRAATEVFIIMTYFTDRYHDILYS